MNRKLRRAKKNKRNGQASKAAGFSSPSSSQDPVLVSLYKQGMEYMEAGQYLDAADIFTNIMQQDPTYFAAIEQLGLALLSLKKYDAALNFFEALCQADPSNIKKYQGYIGCVYVSTDRYEKAIPILEDVSKTIALGAVHLDLAVSYMYLGQREEAKKQYEKAIELCPDNAEYFLKFLSNAGKIESKESPYYDRLKEIEEKADQLDNDTKVLLYYTLFRVHNNFKEYESAFDYACLGAKIKHASLNYVPKSYEYVCDVTKRSFHLEFINNYILDEAVSPSVKPVFVVAMPRSGTTLLEQILGGHPDVKTIGEDAHIHDLFTGYTLKETEGGEISSLYVRDKGNKIRSLQEVAEEYLQYIDGKAPGAKRIVEKSMDTFLILGYIRLVYPNAKFLHIKRSAMDSCVSMFTHYFAKDLQSYSYDMEELAHRYRGYVDMMDYWNSLFPDHILNISYEDLTDRTEEVVREILEFLDLPWDERCLAFYDQKSVVKTASLEQVRKPIYKSSVGRWKRYGDKVHPLLEALGDCA